jgi:hypothetical protein
MPKVVLTSSLVRCGVCPPGARRVDYFDTTFPGFFLEVRASGGKTFYQRYRDERGREHQFKIGSARVLTVSQARGKAKAVLQGAADDTDAERIRSRLIPALREEREAELANRRDRAAHSHPAEHRQAHSGSDLG